MRIRASSTRATVVVTPVVVVVVVLLPPLLLLSSVRRVEIFSWPRLQFEASSMVLPSLSKHVVWYYHSRA